jgi:hypothetical protein
MIKPGLLKAFCSGSQDQPVLNSNSARPKFEQHTVPCVLHERLFVRAKLAMGANAVASCSLALVTFRQNWLPSVQTILFPLLHTLLSSPFLYEDDSTLDF